MVKRVTLALGFVSFVAVYWLLLLRFPIDPAGPQLDESWRRLLAFDFLNDKQAGVDFVFTYGPLASFFLPQGPYVPELFWPRVACELTAKLVIAIVITLAVRRLPSLAWRAGYFAMLIVITPVFQDAAYLAAIGVGVILLLERERLRLVPIVPVLAALAAIGMVKFTFLVLSTACVAALAFRLLTREGWKPAHAAISIYALAFAAIWIVAGQSIVNIPAFLRGSLQISSGYNESMTATGSVPHWVLTTSIPVFLLFAIASATLAERGTWQRLCVISVICAIAFFGWKSGVVRHDAGHLAVLFSLAIIVAFLLAGLPARWPRQARMAQLGTIASALIGAMLTGSDNGHGVRHLHRRLTTARENWLQLTHLHLLRTFRELQLSQMRETHTLRKVRARAAGATIDNVAHDQGILFLNQLEVHHRPVFQSYSSYTPDLQDMNGAFFRSPSAPDLVLFKVQTIDDNLPLVKDSQTYKELLYSYRPTLMERGYLLLERWQRQRSDRTESRVLERDAELGEWVSIRDHDAELLTLSLDVRYSPLGKMRRFAYHVPDLFIEMEVADHQPVHRARIAPCAAKRSFVFSPRVRNTEEFVQLCARENVRRVLRFRLTTDPAHAGCFARRYRLILRDAASLLPPRDAQLTGGQLAIQNGLRYPMFRSFPSSRGPKKNFWKEHYRGKQILGAHAPSFLRFDVKPGNWRLRGHYGIKDAADSAASADGVRFRVVAETRDGQETELFRRDLVPQVESADRGFQRLDVPFTLEQDAAVFLRTEPRDNTHNDWSFWTEVELVRR